MAFPEFRQSITGKGSSPEASSILAFPSKFFFFDASSSLLLPWLLNFPSVNVIEEVSLCHIRKRSYRWKTR